LAGRPDDIAEVLQRAHPGLRETSRVLRILGDQNQVIESRGYQVAISDKGTNDWTFIDGASLTVPELRSLFLTLPEDFKLPEIERRVVPPEERR